MGVKYGKKKKERKKRTMRPGLDQEERSTSAEKKVTARRK